MISRIWHGWTSLENADTYERLLVEEIFPGIEAKQVEGFRGVRLLRRTLSADEVEFVTIMEFTSLDAVKAFAGDDYGAAYIPAAAQQVLARFDRRAQHYDVRETQVDS